MIFPLLIILDKGFRPVYDS